MNSVEMDSEKFQLRAAILYEFKKGFTAAETFRNIRSVFGDDKFRSGNLSLQDEPRTLRPITLAEDRLQETVEQNPRVTTRELAMGFEVSHTTIVTRLRAHGFVSKLNEWVPHDLSERNKIERLAKCSSLLARHNERPFLDRIVTCDEKWVFYDNLERGRSWCAPGQPPQKKPKRLIHSRKILLCLVG